MLQGNSVVKIIIKIIIIFSVNDTGIYDKSDTTKQWGKNGLFNKGTLTLLHAIYTKKHFLMDHNLECETQCFQKKKKNTRE